jgi:hypothetical protein
VCGDGSVTATEQCDGANDSRCPGRCQANCTCAPADAGAFACLAQTGPLLKPSGTMTSQYRNGSLAASTRIDARALTVLASPANRYPINLGGGADVCLAGPRVLGQYDRNLGWDAMHSMNNAGIATKLPFATIDGARIDNVTDGIRPQFGVFTIRQAYMSYIRDDCVENDHLFGGLIEDSLFDGCYVGISSRPSPPILSEGYTGANQLITVSRSLIRLEAQPGPRSGSASGMGHGIFFKWHEVGPQLALHDNVFLAETASQSPSSMGVPSKHLVSCSNNVMVWLGQGNYPTSLPSCFTITRDRSVWDRAVAQWKANHPHVVQ